MGFLDRFTKKTKSAAEDRDQTPQDTRYRAVEVLADEATCCQAAKDIRGQRFLAASAPFLPLQECDAADCRCSYKRYNDRRTDSRRAGDIAFDIIGEHYASEEKRSQQPVGRRASD